MKTIDDTNHETQPFHYLLLGFCAIDLTRVFMMLDLLGTEPPYFAAVKAKAEAAGKLIVLPLSSVGAIKANQKRNIEPFKQRRSHHHNTALILDSGHVIMVREHLDWIMKKVHPNIYAQVRPLAQIKENPTEEAITEP